MKKRIVLLLSLIGLLLVTIVSTSFALFTKSKAQDGINQITTYNCLDISIDGENELNLTNAYPIKDEEGVLQAPYLFTIKNNCDHYVGVDLGVEYQEESTINADIVKATLNKPTEGIIPQILSSYTKVQATDSETGLPIENAKYIMVHEGLPAGDEQAFEYRMWIDYSVEDLSPSDKLKVKIVAIGTVQSEEEAPKNWYSSEGNTLLAALRNNNSVRKTLTVPGKQNSLKKESVLASAEDDYGISFYYRGSVENNYVVFAGKCWRVVRITGDGSIKLLYWSNNTTCTSPSYAFSSDTFNTVTGNASIGYMYGDVNGSTYEEVHANLYDSSMLTYLKSWYNSTFQTSTTTEYSDLISDVIWCNDKSLVSGSGVGSTNTTYGSSVRYLPTSSAKPILTCPSAGADGKLSKFTAEDTEYGNGKLRGVNGEGDKLYKIGLLTADEYIYAGVIGTTPTNPNVYLFKGSWYWTITPYATSKIRYYHYHSYIHPDGVNVNNSPGGRIAPSIALIPTTTITSGDGTVNNPYVINV